MITESTRARFAREVAKYPAEQKQSAVMACLSIVQQEQGFVSAESEAVIAEYLGMAQIAVHEVTTFYNMYNQQPVGKYKLNVCTNLPCQLRDGQKALHHLEKKLGVTMGETTADGLFTLQQCECLGACADAPVMLVNDRTMCSFMDNDKLDQLVDGLRAAEGQACPPLHRPSRSPRPRAPRPASTTATSTRRSTRAWLVRTGASRTTKRAAAMLRCARSWAPMAVNRSRRTRSSPLSRNPACAAVAVRVSPPASSGASCPARSQARSTSCATPMKASLARARIATFFSSTRTSLSKA